MKPAIFLDRDGVITRNRDDYVKSLDEVVFIDAALAIAPRLALSQFKIFIVTNQSAVGRNIISLEEAQRINRFVCDRLNAAGGRIDAVYMCPHHPNAACGCRKPKPGMLLRAAAEYPIDLARSFMIGDAVSDYEAAAAAGVTGVLVRSGRGRVQERLLQQRRRRYLAFDDIAEAYGWIAAKQRTTWRGRD